MGRAADMLWMQFGTMRQVARRRGGTKSVGDWAIHVQCAWRLCRCGRIVVAYRDYYHCLDGNALDDWDSPGKSRFDQAVEALNAEFDESPPSVVAPTGDDVGGFSLTMTHDYRLDAFPDSSNKGGRPESWRVFEPQMGRKHFVVP
jgi:hypothetical protein